MALTETDPVALAKALTEYAKENPIFTFKSGVVEGRVVNLADFNALATLPSKEALFSKVLFLFNSPAQRVASTLAGVARNLAVCDFRGGEGKEISEVKQYRQRNSRRREQRGFRGFDLLKSAS